MRVMCKLPAVAVFTAVCSAIGFPVLAQQNQVIMIKPTVQPQKLKGPCPVRLEFKATIMADEFGDVEYRWLRSDGLEMPVETLSLPESGRKRSGEVSMSWDVAPYSAPKGEEYWADVEVLSPESLGSSGRARAWIMCDDAGGSSRKSGGQSTGGDTDSGDSTEPADDSLFVLGGADSEDEIVVGELEESPTEQPAEPRDEPPRPAPRPKSFACPVRAVGVKVVGPLPYGWQPDVSGNTATAELKAHTVNGSGNATQLVCMYQNGRWLLPLTRPIPSGYASCTRESNFYFRCTG